MCRVVSLHYYYYCGGDHYIHLVYLGYSFFFFYLSICLSINLSNLFTLRDCMANPTPHLWTPPANQESALACGMDHHHHVSWPIDLLSSPQPPPLANRPQEAVSLIDRSILQPFFFFFFYYSWCIRCCPGHVVTLLPELPTYLPVCLSGYKYTRVSPILRFPIFFRWIFHRIKVCGKKKKKKKGFVRITRNKTIYIYEVRWDTSPCKAGSTSLTYLH